MVSAGNPSRRLPGRNGRVNLRGVGPLDMLVTMTRSCGRTSASRLAASRLAVALCRLLVAGLAAFHVWLFGARLVDGRLHDPLVALRWLAGVALLGGLIWLRRLGLPAMRGRRAAGLWTLVFLLHCHAVAVPGSGSTSPVSLPAIIEAVVVVVGGVVGAGLLLAVARAAAARRPTADLAWHLTPCPAAGSVSAAHLLTIAPRPPPL